MCWLSVERKQARYGSPDESPSSLAEVGAQPGSSRGSTLDVGERNKGGTNHAQSSRLGERQLCESLNGLQLGDPREAEAKAGGFWRPEPTNELVFHAWKRKEVAFERTPRFLPRITGTGEHARCPQAMHRAGKDACVDSVMSLADTLAAVWHLPFPL